jgi:hypothetical protein
VPGKYAWRRHVGVRTEASATSRLDQMRVAQWGYEHAAAFWGCFQVTGHPITAREFQSNYEMVLTPRRLRETGDRA